MAPLIKVHGEPAEGNKTGGSVGRGDIYQPHLPSCMAPSVQYEYSSMGLQDTLPSIFSW